MDTISKWYGGFGNNILQLGNGLTHAFFKKTKFRSPPHLLVKPIKIEFGQKFSEPGIYFNLNLQDYGDIQQVLKVREFLIKEIVVPNLLLDELHSSVEQEIKNERNLVAHIRGGDIFQPHHVPVHSGYVQAPLRYYEFVSEKYDNVYVINQDDKNPIASELQKNPKFKFLSKTLRDDVAILMRASNLVIGGIGTFVFSCVLCSKSVEKIYVPDFAKEFWKKNFVDVEKLISVNLPNYIQEGAWTGSEQQKNSC